MIGIRWTVTFVLIVAGLQLPAQNKLPCLEEWVFRQIDPNSLIRQPKPYNLVLITADWCAPCKPMKKQMDSLCVADYYSHKMGFSFLNHDSAKEELQGNFNITAIPYLLVFDPNGRIVRRFSGYLPDIPQFVEETTTFFPYWKLEKIQKQGRLKPNTAYQLLQNLRDAGLPYASYLPEIRELKEKAKPKHQSAQLDSLLAQIEKESKGFNDSPEWDRLNLVRNQIFDKIKNEDSIGAKILMDKLRLEKGKIVPAPSSMPKMKVRYESSPISFDFDVDEVLLSANLQLAIFRNSQKDFSRAFLAWLHHFGLEAAPMYIWLQNNLLQKHYPLLSEELKESLKNLIMAKEKLNEWDRESLKILETGQE